MWPLAARRCWVGTSWPLLRVLVRAGPRSGPTVWEIKELYLGRGQEDSVHSVLETVNAQAASASALKIVIRVLAGDDAERAIRRAAFSPTHQEHFYRRAARPGRFNPRGISEPTQLPGLRPRQPSDLHSLFRLYSLATPVTVRTNWAMTAQEWADAQEPTPSDTEDWVVEDQSEARVWIRMGRTDSFTWFTVVGSPGCEERRVQAIEGLLAGSENREAVALVAGYDLATAGALESLGFQRERTFQMLAKTLPIRTVQPARVVATAGP